MIDELLGHIALASWDSGIVSQEAIIAVQAAVTSLLIPIAIMVLQDHGSTKPNWLFNVMLNECVKPLRLIFAAILPFVAIALLWIAYPGWVIIFVLICNIYFMKNIAQTFQWFSCRHQLIPKTQPFKCLVVSRYIDKLNSKSDEEFPTLIQLWRETWLKPNRKMLADIQPLLICKFFETIKSSNDEHIPPLAITLFAAINDDGINLLNYQSVSHTLDIAFYLIEHGYDAIGSNIICLATTSLSKIGPYGLIHRYANEYINNKPISDKLKYKIVKSVTTVDLDLIATRKNISLCHRWVEEASSNKNNVITQGFLDATISRLFQLIDNYRRASDRNDVVMRRKIADLLDKTVSLSFPFANQRIIGDILTLAHPPIIVSKVDDYESPLNKLIKMYNEYRGDYLLSDYVMEPPIGPDEVGNSIGIEELNKIFDQKKAMTLKRSTEQAANLMAKTDIGLSISAVDKLIACIDSLDGQSLSLLKLRDSLYSYKIAHHQD